MFFLKKALGPFFFPLSLSLELLVLGLALLWFTRRLRAGKILVTLGTVLLFFFSFQPFADLLLGPLERWYPACASPREVPAPVIDSSVKWIVVLGGGHTSDPEVPLISRLNSSTLERLVEGLALSRALPGAKLILSGGAVFDPTPGAEVMARAARTLGAKPQNLVLDPYSRDTEDEAKIIKSWVGKEKFFLVTSASHLRRAVALFEKQGMAPIPWPVGHLVKKSPKFNPFALFPSPHNLNKTETAFYEYLGLTWGWMRGAI